MEDDEAYALSLYQALRASGEADATRLVTATGLGGDQVERGLRRLRRLGLVRETGGVLEPVEPDTALLGKMGAHRSTAAAHAASATELEQLTHALLTRYRPAVADEASQFEVEFVSDRRTKDRRLRDLNAEVKLTCDSLHPGGMPPMDVLTRSLAEDARLVERGVHCRAIYRQGLLQTPKHARYLHELAQIGVEVRLIEHAAYDLLLLDRTIAWIPAAPGTTSPSVVLFRGAALINAQIALYEDCWLRAVPYPKALADSEQTALPAQERAVVRLMSGGLSDDQIARKLGVHRRTVQRTVARLMERLNASSRFEAGMKLARTMGGPSDVPERPQLFRPRQPSPTSPVSSSTPGSTDSPVPAQAPAGRSS